MRRLLSLTLFALLATGACMPAAAQTPDDQWHVVVVPYLMGAAITGTATVLNRDVDVDVSASDIFSNLQFGAMGMVTARKGNWGVGGDAIWMALGMTVGNVNVDFNQGAFAFYGLRALGPSADLAFGLRVNTLQGKLDFKGVEVERSQDKTWVDPIVGLTLRSPSGHRVVARVFSEIGGFGAGSDFTWQIFPTVGIMLGKGASLEGGYRWLDIDYSSGEDANRFAWDMLTQGPVVGVGFRF